MISFLELPSLRNVFSDYQSCFHYTSDYMAPSIFTLTANLDKLNSQNSVLSNVCTGKETHNTLNPPTMFLYTLHTLNVLLQLKWLLFNVLSTKVLQQTEPRFPQHTLFLWQTFFMPWSRNVNYTTWNCDPTHYTSVSYKIRCHRLTEII